MSINWLLIGILAVIAACVCHGYRAGLVRMLFSVATFVVTVIVVRLLAPAGVQMLKSNEHIYEGIRQPIVKLLDENMNGQVRTEEVLESIHVSEEVRDSILQAAEGIGVAEVDVFTPQMKGIAADCITLRLIDMLAYVILFILINVGLRVIGTLLDYFSKLPGIRGVNRLAGGALGLVEAVAFVWLAFVVMTVFAATQWGSWCFGQIADSQILSALYAYNVFLVFV